MSIGSLKCFLLPNTSTRTQLKDLSIVKFDTDQLPPILNSLETSNNGQKLVLEVAVGEQPQFARDMTEHLEATSG